MDKLKNIEMSVVIVTYNSEKDITPCLESIRLSETTFGYEIIIIDNDSKDRTLEKISDFSSNFKDMNLSIVRSENNGFNAGNNLGIKRANGRYILLLNPDTEVFADTLENLYQCANGINNLGSLGCSLINDEGKNILSAGYFPSITSCFRKIFKRNYVKINQNNTLQDVDFPSGATFLFEKKIIDSVGLMDEHYFIFYDEADFAFQMKKKGYKNYILTSTKVVHKFGQSTSTVSDFSVQKNIESYFYFLNKNYNNVYAKLIISVDFLIVLIQYLIAKSLNHRSHKYFRQNIDLFCRNI